MLLIDEAGPVMARQALLQLISTASDLGPPGKRLNIRVRNLRELIEEGRD